MLASCDVKTRDTLRMAAFLSVVDCDCLNLFAIFRFFVVHTVPFLSLTMAVGFFCFVATLLSSLE
jgi:hypothetical protein